MNDIANNPGITTDQIVTLMMVSIIVLALVVLGMTYIVYILVKKRKVLAQTGEAVEGADAVVEEPAALSWKGISHVLTDAVPISKEDTIDLGHNYDGIRELDNKLPPWWQAGFYISIVFAVVYMFIYHVNSDWSSDQEYQTAMAEGEEMKKAYLAKSANLVDESSVTVLTDASSLDAGKEIYVQNCIACHGMAGEGNAVGPNLTDEYWLHGGGIKNIFKTIKYGVPEKGMISWQNQLNPQKMQQVASYIFSLVGTDPPNAKAPQGELYSPDGGNEEAPADSTAGPMAVK